MTTLHALRRTYALSFSELALLTAVPARRLAEFEYHGCPLSPAERNSLAAFFGVTTHALEGGFGSPVAVYPTLNRARALAALAATAVLAWSLRIAPSLPLPSFSAFGAAAIDSAPQPIAAAPTATVAPTAAPATATPRRTDIAQRRSADGAAQEVLDDPLPIKVAIKPLPSPTIAPPTPIPPTPIPANEPGRCPIVPAQGQVSLTQSYGIGTHAPANVWGALDLVVRDGTTAGTPVIATHAGKVTVTLNSWPGGNFVSISSDKGWRTGYAHLNSVAVQTGQYVEAGTVIGAVGSTGQSTGPHLHYETWQDGTNVDPSPRLFCN